MFVAGVEIPLNAMSFEIFDRGSDETRLMAVVFGLLIAVLAHFTGYGFKRSRSGDKTYSAIGWIGVFIALIAFATTASFRVQYMEMMKMDNSLGFLSQFAFALIIFSIGVMASYFHTSDVKNITLEKTFKNDLKEVESLEKEVKKLSQKKDALNKKYQRDFALIEQSIKDTENVKAADDRAKIKLELQNQEDNKADLDNKNAEFENLDSKFKSSMDELYKIKGKFTGDIKVLKQDISYIRLISRIKGILAEAENFSVNGKDARLTEMNNEFNNLIA